jgi:hypothetical protein
LQEEVAIDKLRKVDIVVSTPSQKIAVEVDGPSHFIATLLPETLADFHRTNCWIDGSTQLRNWLLKKRGMDVVSINFYETAWRRTLGYTANSTKVPEKAIMNILSTKLKSVLARKPALVEKQPADEVGGDGRDQ